MPRQRRLSPAKLLEAYVIGISIAALVSTTGRTAASIRRTLERLVGGKDALDRLPRGDESSIIYGS